MKIAAALLLALFAGSWLAPESPAFVPYLHGGLLAFAAWLAILNCYLSWIRPLLYRRTHGSFEGYRFVSGIPFFSTIFVVVAVFNAWGNDLVAIAALAIQAIDTGSLFWCAFVMRRE